MSRQHVRAMHYNIADGNNAWVGWQVVRVSIAISYNDIGLGLGLPTSPNVTTARTGLRGCDDYRQLQQQQQQHP